MGSTAGTGPDLAELTNGNIVVVWADGDVSDGNEDIRGQIISADGDKIGGEFTINSSRQWTRPLRRWRTGDSSSCGRT